jgi:hypothetical protein
MRLLTVLITILLTTAYSNAQDLTNIKDANPFEFSGSIVAGTSFNKTYNREDRRSPYAYFISANPVFSFYGIQVPVSFTYRDQKGSISQPFNRYLINPTYKWISLHVGNTRLTMNPYVMSGQVVKGVGLELTPKKFRFSAVYGNLENPLAQLDSIVGGAILLEAYKRKAYSAKLGYGSARNFFELTAFKAKDDISKMSLEEVRSRSVKPEDNVVLGLGTVLSPSKWLSFRANGAVSAHTANQTTPNIIESEELKEIQDQYEDIITLNLSSKLQYAGDASLDFRFKYFGFGGEYKRVQPFYKSLGTYYFQEDYENILAKFNFRMLKNKIRFTGRGGLQRNNLEKTRSATNARQVLNASLSLIPTPKIFMNLRYANMQSDRNPNITAVNDSLRLTRTTGSYGGVTRVSFGSRERASAISLTANYQNLQDLLGGASRNNEINNYNGSLSYNLRIKEKQTSLIASLLGNQNTIDTLNRTRLGGSLQYGIRLLEKKLALTSNAGYMTNFLNGTGDGSTMTFRVGARFTKKKSWSTSVNINYLNRIGGTTPFSEIRGNFRVSYSIKPIKVKRNEKSKS